MKKLRLGVIAFGELAILLSALWESGVLGKTANVSPGVIRADPFSAALVDIGGPWPQTASWLVTILSFVALYLLCKFLGALLMQSLEGKE